MRLIRRLNNYRINWRVNNKKLAKFNNKENIWYKIIINLNNKSILLI